ncbi:hypothetical protein ACS0TY_006739 [Phlomoides rotata]
MGSQPIQLLAQFSIPISQKWNYHRRFADDHFRWRFFSGGRSGSSRWEWGKKANPNLGSRFSDAYVTNEYDEEGGFGSFRNTAKQRVWWSDDLYAEDDEEEDEGFGILEASIGFDWVFKVFRAFGWMIPAVIISFLMGTGPNGIIMTLALPLAQSALSLATETLWERADETPRPRKSKRPSKKRPFAGAQRRTRVGKEEEIRSQTRKEAGNYKSWLEGNNASSKKKEMNGQDFGGWDELDRQVRADKEPRTTSVKQGDEPRKEERLKISRSPKGDSQLFMRFLIAMFPFLGFWTKLF